MSRLIHGSRIHIGKWSAPAYASRRGHARMRSIGRCVRRLQSGVMTQSTEEPVVPRRCQKRSCWRMPAASPIAHKHRLLSAIGALVGLTPDTPIRRRGRAERRRGAWSWPHGQAYSRTPAGRSRSKLRAGIPVARRLKGRMAPLPPEFTPTKSAAPVGKEAGC